MTSLLDKLRSTSSVSCDTLDVHVAQTLGTFADCTSNQAIAFFELSKIVGGKLKHEELIKEAIEDAKGPLSPLQHQQSLEDFVVDILMVKLQLRFLPYITGYVHVQINPRLTDSTEIVDRAQSLCRVAAALLPHESRANLRICIKIPGTWHGIQACRQLENSDTEKIATLATTMFCMEQAALANNAGCTYIAPYVNELRVHFDASYKDEDKAFDFCRKAQAYFVERSSKTRVLAASLTSVAEVMHLSGIQGITISPPLLEQLSSQATATWDGSLDSFTQKATPPNTDLEALVTDEATWTNAFKQSGNGTCFAKLEQAIQYFCEFQDKLEALVSNYTEAN